MWHAAIFVAFLVWFVYLPATSIVSLLKMHENDWLVQAAITMGVGIAVVTLIAFLSRIMGMEFVALWILSTSSIHGLFVQFRQLRIHMNISYILVLLAIVFGMIAQASALIRAGGLAAEGLQLRAVHDTGWNIAIARQILAGIPPQHPAMSGETLKNTHYFYPVFVAAAHSISRIPLLTLYYRLMPFAVSLFFGLSLYAVASEYTQSAITRVIAVLVGYFSGNVAYILMIWKGWSFDWRGNTFYADQPFDQIVNPYTVVGFSLFLLCGLAYKRLTESTVMKKHWAVVLFILLSVLYGYKAFAGVIAVAGILLSSLIGFVITGKKRHIAVSILSILSALPAALYLTEIGNAGLQWAPGWLLDQMTVGDNRLNMPDLIQIKQYYASIHNWPGLTKIYAFQLGIYLIGNFGIRLLGIFCLVKMLVIWIRRKKEAAGLTFFLISICIATVIPLLFNLRNSAYNITQFTPYGFVVAGLFTGIWSRRLLHHRAFLIILIVLSCAGNWKNMMETFQSHLDTVPASHLLALAYMANDPGNGAILLNPRDFELLGYPDLHPIHVSALTGRALYYANDGLIAQTGRDPSVRRQSVERFFQGTVDGRTFLSEQGIRFVYLLKPQLQTDKRAVLEKYGLRIMIETEETAVYSL